MDCTVIESELVGFHFATLEEAARARVEEHLYGCAGCVRAFMALKRAVECEAAAPSPSDAARARLRAAVAARVKPRAARRWMWLGSAAAAVAAAFVLGTLYRAPVPSRAVGEAVDSARAVPASFNVL